MKHVFLLAWVLFTITAAFAATAAEQKGPYADEGKDKTTGDLKDQDYWWAKWDAEMLDDARARWTRVGRRKKKQSPRRTSFATDSASTNRFALTASAGPR